MSRLSRTTLFCFIIFFNAPFLNKIHFADGCAATVPGEGGIPEACKTCEDGALINGATTYNWAQWNGATPATTCLDATDPNNLVPLANPPSTFDITNLILTDNGSTADTCRVSIACTGTDPLLFNIIKQGDQEACVVFPLSALPAPRTLACPNGLIPPPGEPDFVAMGCGVPA
ncbi:hypothetical protein WR25_19712 [Diploscapter pachys]|uniref:Uncharacterized protein n=1 Tax=Diploscapter pachys TaxID=2018661 RepID=A0A2A2JVR2_9BILA|nr:hypothetical protein WR25_19712 [Diploscapter pachys]